MKLPPNYIIMKQTYRYLSDQEKTVLEKHLAKHKIKNKPFLNCLVRHFDIEVFKTKPLIWQDIWLYNYIKYEKIPGKPLRRSGLIAQYEREAYVEDDAEFFEKAPLINAKGLNNNRIYKTTLNK